MKQPPVGGSVFLDYLVLEVDLALRFFAPATTTQVSCLIALPKNGTVARMRRFSGIGPKAEAILKGKH